MVAFTSRHDLDKVILSNDSGIQIQLLTNGVIFGIYYDQVMVNQILGHPLEGSIQNVYLRVKIDHKYVFTPLIGPLSSSEFFYQANSALWSGVFEGINYDCQLVVHPEEPIWFWELTLSHSASNDVEVDVIYVQDIGLSHENVIRLNEAYCSQYIDHVVLQHQQYGYVLCTRQNQSSDGGHPWLLQGAFNVIRDYVTDGFSFYGLSYKETNTPKGLIEERLASQNVQYEMALVGLQSESYQIQPHNTQKLTFFAYIESDYPQATQDHDLDKIDLICEKIQSLNNLDHHADSIHGIRDNSLFSEPNFLSGLTLSEQEIESIFVGSKRHVERRNNSLLSFFYRDHQHVVLKAKEHLVERSHGHILRSSLDFFPHEDIMSSTSYMYGLFHSHVTIGNTSFHKILSITRSPLNIFKSSGQRIFVQQNGQWQLLGMPSAYEIGRDFARWLYKTEYGMVDVKAWVSSTTPVGYLSIQSDTPRVFLVSHHIVLDHAEWESRGEIVIDDDNALVQLIPDADTNMKSEYPESVFYLAAAQGELIQTIGGDELLFADGQMRGLPYVVFQTKPVTSVTLLMTGSVLDAQSARERCRVAQQQAIDFEADMARTQSFWLGLANGFTLQSPVPQVGKMQDIIAWYLHNGMIHYTTPHGLEQYTGAAWGVRDVCQGPVELLLATRQYAYVKAIIKTVFAQQYEDTADWPQWFMFDRYVKIQHAESHGDIIVWPLKAVASYIEVSHDFSILDELIPYTDRASFNYTDSTSTLFNHVGKAIEAIEQRLIPQTYLSSYGAGDWNDTLQPANPSMRENMVSAWTVSLTYQVFRQLEHVFQLAGKAEWAVKLATLCQHMHADFNTYLVKDDTVCGMAYFHSLERIDYLLHPSDTQTHISYRLLPMIRSIIGELFSPEQMHHHLAIIDQHLTFPDGVRLMDRPVQYRGGVRKFFRRAEESSNFGRETGLQYVHAHIRYIEALCKAGQAQKAFEAILTILPITLNEQVNTALPRQSNAYFSSSDADFKDRYEASANFDKIKSLQVGVKGGWRIYSSGPGILIHQIICHFLGLRDSFGHVVIDPVLPRELDGLTVQFKYGAENVTYRYHIQNDVDFEVQQITINGQNIAFTFDENPYRPGGARIRQTEFQRWLTQADNRVEVTVG